MEHIEKLKKAYEAIEILKSLGMNFNAEQRSFMAEMEKDYLEAKVVTHIKKEISPLMEEIKQRVKFEIKYDSKNGLEINVIDGMLFQREKILPYMEKGKRHRMYYIRVLFPDNHVSCSKTVWETLVDVVKYAGARKVQSLGMNLMGMNLVSSTLHSNERYRVGQKEVEPGLYVCTYSSTDTKYEQIKRINKELNLGLKLEKVLI